MTAKKEHSFREGRTHEGNSLCGQGSCNVGGGALPASAMNAVHASFFDVARIRAEPLEKRPAEGVSRSEKVLGRVAGQDIGDRAKVSIVGHDRLATVHGSGDSVWQVAGVAQCGEPCAVAAALGARHQREISAAATRGFGAMLPSRTRHRLRNQAWRRARRYGPRAVHRKRSRRGARRTRCERETPPSKDTVPARRLG